MIENIIVLVLCSILTSTAKGNKGAGYLVIAYYSIYIALEVGEFGFLEDDAFQLFNSSMVWYLMCASLSSLFSVWASSLYMSNGGAIYLYAIWLILDAVICSILALSQAFETNAILLLYNILQNINLYIDMLMVIVGTEHIIKRNFKGAALFINSVNSCAERWLNLVFNSSFKGAAQCKKN